MLIELKTAETEDDFLELEELARDIWLEHYDGIVDLDQIRYMLDSMQSAQAIAQQVQDGYIYDKVLIDTEPAGYLAYRMDTAEKKLFISKFYVAQPYRGSGVGKHMLAVMEAQASKFGCRTLWLTVNRNNTNTIAAYEKMGFRNKGELQTDIGQGYIMDDFKLVKILPFNHIAV